MPTNIIERDYASDWLKREADSLYSRDQGILLIGQGVVKSGTVLGRVTASGKLKVRTLAAADGSQNVAGILLDTVDTTNGDERVVFIARDAIVAHQGLTRGSDVDTAAERATENAALAALGILVREGA
ncbi:head decoration protein [Methylobacterium nigriterrae]|uniref:head decoration protein n=1 Tax=Methylobacterium nigriterrae TaxID=3127512 RepID=UPI003013D34C